MNPYLIIVIAALWGLSIVGSATKWASLKVAEVRAEYLAADNKALAEEKEKSARLRAERDAAENKGNINVAAIGNELEKEKRDHAKTRAARDRALRAGTERVSVAVTSCEGATGTGATPSGETGEPTTARAYLHPAVAANLEQLTGEADDVVRELNACIKVVDEDRRIVNDWLAARAADPPDEQKESP